MAKISVNFDTNEKTLSASIDGKEVENLYEVAIYKSFDGDKFTCSVTTAVKDEGNDMYQVTRLMANQENPQLAPALDRIIAQLLGRG